MSILNVLFLIYYHRHIILNFLFPIQNSFDFFSFLIIINVGCAGANNILTSAFSQVKNTAPLK